MANPTAAHTNWKREPWVWLLIAIPTSAIVMGVVMLTLAIQSFSGLVVDDYYKKGKQINRVLARDRVAWELGLRAHLEVGPSGQFSIRFPPEVDFVPGDSMEFKMVHSTKPGFDQTLQLKRESRRQLSGRFRLTGSGRWNLFLQTSDWRLTGSLRQPGQSRAELLPNYGEE